MPRLNLRVKLLASFILVLLPILGLLIYGYREGYERQIDTALDQQMQTAQAVTALVDASFDEAFALAWALTDDPAVRTLDPSRIDPHLQRLAPHYPQFEAFGVNNTAGDVVGISIPIPPGAPRPGSAADRPAFKRVMATGQPVVSDLIISRSTFRPSISLYVPLRDEDGKLIGAVGVAPYLDAFSKKIESVSLDPEQNVLLTDKTGTAAFYTALPDLPWEQRNLGDFEPVKAAVEGRPTRLRRFVSPLLGDTRIGAFVPSPKYGWVVGVSVPEDVALAPVSAALRDQLLGFGAVAILSFGLILLLSSRLLQPIRRLTAHALALGRGDLEQRVQIKTGDEIEDLGRTFNQMADEIGTRAAEREQLLRQVEQSDRLKDQFLTVAAHELKTPVTGIKGFAQFLLRREHEGVSPMGLKALEAINRQSDRIGRLVNELLETSRVQTGRLELHPTRFDLSQLAAEIVEQMKIATEKHELLFQSPGPVLVNADRERIGEVLSTLLDNAIKFSPQGGPSQGRIETTVGIIEGEAVASVRDHGVGIPKDRQDRIFERFYRAHTGTPYDYGGMGVALFISNEIIARHGGRMWFESEVGKGSTFYFSLPLA